MRARFWDLRDLKCDWSCHGWIRGVRAFGRHLTHDDPVGAGCVVQRPAALDPGILLTSVGRNLKPYTVAELQSRWVLDVDVVYIGKAAGGKGPRGRLRPVSGLANNHSGGRSIWQLSTRESLVVAWKAIICRVMEHPPSGFSTPTCTPRPVLEH